jgi:predicted cobalt transporter CbtA
VIWEPFVLALVLGLIISAGLYFAYLWPSVEPIDDAPAPGAAPAAARSDDDAASPAP